MFASAKLTIKLIDWAEVTPSDHTLKQFQSYDEKRDAIVVALETSIKFLRDKNVADDVMAEALEVSKRDVDLIEQ